MRLIKSNTTRRIILLVSVGLLSACASVTDKTRTIMTLDAQAQNAYEQRRCEEAITLYQKLADRLPKNTESLLRIGNCHARNQRYEQAMRAYRDAIARDSGYIKAWYNLSYLQAKVLGLTLAQMSANIDPNDPSMAAISQMAKQLLSIYNKPADQSDQAARLPMPAKSAPALSPKDSKRKPDATDANTNIDADHHNKAEADEVP
ncbi:MAG: tetratricopeptide repeat protein [Pseudomonadota bacterium]